MMTNLRVEEDTAEALQVNHTLIKHIAFAKLLETVNVILIITDR